ncbi:unnamed protein product, partial [Absidia cylindrospora]
MSTIYLDSKQVKWSSKLPPLVMYPRDNTRYQICHGLGRQISCTNDDGDLESVLVDYAHISNICIGSCCSGLGPFEHRVPMNLPSKHIELLVADPMRSPQTSTPRHQSQI